MSLHVDNGNVLLLHVSMLHMNIKCPEEFFLGMY